VRTLNLFLLILRFSFAARQARVLVQMIGDTFCILGLLQALEFEKSRKASLKEQTKTR